MHNSHQHDRDRIERLRALAAKLDRLPRSDARDRLLRDVRRRTVLVDTVPSVHGSDHVALFEQMTVRPFRSSR